MDYSTKRKMATSPSLLAQLPQLVPVAALADAGLAVRGERVLGPGQLQAEVLVLAAEGSERGGVGGGPAGGSGQ